MNDLNVSVGFLAQLVLSSKDQGGKKAEKMQQWKQILADSVQPPAFQKWTNVDKKLLYDMENRDIKLGNAAYRNHKALKERELEAMVHSMSREKRTS